MRRQQSILPLFSLTVRAGDQICWLPLCIHLIGLSLFTDYMHHSLGEHMSTIKPATMNISDRAQWIIDWKHYIFQPCYTWLRCHVTPANLFDVPWYFVHDSLALCHIARRLSTVTDVLCIEALSMYPCDPRTLVHEGLGCASQPIASSHSISTHYHPSFNPISSSGIPPPAELIVLCIYYFQFEILAHNFDLYLWTFSNTSELNIYYAWDSRE